MFLIIESYSPQQGRRRDQAPKVKRLSSYSSLLSLHFVERNTKQILADIFLGNAQNIDYNDKVKTTEINFNN